MLGSGGLARGSVPTEIIPGVAADALEHFNLPDHFEALISDRKLIDTYQQAHYRVETSQRPTPDVSMTTRNRNPAYVRAIVPQYTSDVLEYWRALPESFVPLRGYRAPILSRADELMQAVYPPAGLTEKSAAAAELIVRKLAHDGLLLTLAQVIETLGPEAFLKDSAEGISLLRQVGFPTGLLGCFQFEERKADPEATTIWIARKLRNGSTPDDLKAQLAAVPFRFRASEPGFHVATESGESELGLLRMQADGGYRDGIVPGSSIDVICQAVAAMPNANSIISLPREQLEPFEWMARNWRLRHTNQVTLIGEPFSAEAWAQDNGKAGRVTSHDGHVKLATITPRYASQAEGKSNFKKAESLLMDGLRSAGHEVVQSRLLFQGGNLLAVRDPRSGERILLLSEGCIHRNRALGLTPEQVQEAFRIEFGVDRCVIIPATSYHMDFDVTVRTHGGELIAFVNDTRAAAREIVQIGIGALERGGICSAAAAGAARANLAAGRDEAVVRQISEVVQKARGESSTLPDKLAAGFALDKTDSAAGNLQTFLLALDILESALPDVKGTPERRAYLQALRCMHERCEAQTTQLRGLGWKLVTIPSMTDLFRSINYLNGVHHKGGYLMPVFGGLYAPLDRIAAARFQAVLGSEIRMQPIRSAECQRYHGGVHCTVAAYPKL